MWTSWLEEVDSRRHKTFLVVSSLDVYVVALLYCTVALEFFDNCYQYGYVARNTNIHINTTGSIALMFLFQIPATKNMIGGSDFRQTKMSLAL